MRAVKSTIAAAGILKRNNVNGDESEIVLKALIDINLPKFLEQDISLFQNIISDLFPKTKKPENQFGILSTSINESLKELNLNPIPGFVKKVYQLLETMEVRHGIMLVGATGSGKTSNFNVLKLAISRISPQITDTEEQKKLNP